MQSRPATRTASPSAPRRRETLFIIYFPLARTYGNEVLKALSVTLFHGGGDSTPQLHISALRRSHAPEYLMQGTGTFSGGDMDFF